MAQARLRTASSRSEEAAAVSLIRIKEGMLVAETSKSRKWRSMFFVLAETSDSQVNVYAFKHRHRGDGVPEACMRLLDAHIDVLQNMIMVQRPQRTWYLIADSATEATSWATAMCTARQNLLEGLRAAAQSGLAPPKGAAATATSRGSRRSASHPSSPSSRSALRSRRAAHSPHEAQDAESGTAISPELWSEVPPPRPITAGLVLAFKRMFMGCTEAVRRELAATGKLEGVGLRSICWKRFLGCLPHDAPVSAWPDSMQSQRALYEEQRAEVLRPGDDSMDSTDLEVHSIVKDVLRTQPHIAALHTPDMQRLMLRLLIVFARQHPALTYKQGMSDILSVVLLLLLHESVDDEGLQLAAPTSAAPAAAAAASPLPRSPHAEEPVVRSATHSVLRVLLARSFVEHDAYLLFGQIMARMKDVYSPVAPALLARASSRMHLASGANPGALGLPMYGPSAGASALRSAGVVGAWAAEESTPVPSLVDQFAQQQSPGERDAASAASTASTASGTAAGGAADKHGGSWEPAVQEEDARLMTKLARIQEVLLQSADTALYRHMKHIDLAPGMYGLRWMRLMFLREFDLPQLWLVWDAVLADTPDDFELAEYVAVAMLCHLRAALFRCDDQPSAAQHLFGFSQLRVPASPLVARARMLRQTSPFYAAAEAAAVTDAAESWVAGAPPR